MNSERERPLHVCHVISCLGTGGAQRMLTNLLATLDRTEFSAEVIALRARGPFADRIENLGIPVRCLQLSKPWHVGRLHKLTRFLQRSQPDVVQTWLYHADLIGGLAASRLRRRDQTRRADQTRRRDQVPVVWNVRHSTLQPTIDKTTTRLTRRACARMSHRLATAVVVNSQAGKKIHEALGYRSMVWIPNGVDVGRFRPQPTARRDLLQELGLPPSARLVGMLARFHPMKGHHEFLKALRRLFELRGLTERHRLSTRSRLSARSRLSEEAAPVHAVLCGSNVTNDNRTLGRWLEETGTAPWCHLLGSRSDAQRIMAAVDVVVSPSVAGEGFPTTLAEAMACETPCVASDVGDAADIVGETGRIVPPGDVNALARSCDELLSLGDAARRQLGRRTRRHIVARYDLPDIAARYGQLWRNVRDHGSECREPLRG